MKESSLLRRPSAFFPLAMSIAALGVVLGALAAYGPQPQADEGAAAHLFQLLLAAQAPIILIFAVKWLPRAPREATLVLLLQVGAALAALAPVLLLGW